MQQETNLLDFMQAHPIATFFCFWVLAGSISAVVRAAMMYITVLCRGWPPSHINAQGQFRPLPKPIQPTEFKK